MSRLGARHALLIAGIAFATRSVALTATLAVALSLLGVCRFCCEGARATVHRGYVR